MRSERDWEREAEQEKKTEQEREKTNGMTKKDTDRKLSEPTSHCGILKRHKGRVLESLYHKFSVNIIVNIIVLHFFFFLNKKFILH